MWKVLVAVVCLSACTSISGQAQDLGNPDTLTLVSNGLAVGESRPIEVWVANDEELVGMQLTFRILQVDSGFARFDSIVPLGRLLDPSVLGQRIISRGQLDNVSPDTLTIALLRQAGNALPVGSGPIVALYFTGLSQGAISIDSSRDRLNNGTQFVGEGSHAARPIIISLITDVVGPLQPPTLVVPTEFVRAQEMQAMSFGVVGNSPYGAPVTLSLESVTDFDDAARTPVSSPSFDNGNPGTLEWTPGASDAGIWLATFRGIDSAGRVAEASVRIQVVSGAGFDLTFTALSTDSVLTVKGITHGDFDEDNVPELAMCGLQNPGTKTPLVIYEYDDESGLKQAFTIENGFVMKAMVSGYFGADDHLDIGVSNTSPNHPGLWLYRGKGNNTFTRYDQYSPQDRFRSAVCCDFDHDAAIDIAAVDGSNTLVFAGHLDSDFVTAVECPSSDVTMSVNAGDFNNDGWDDLAVGTSTGLDIYLNDMAGGLTLAHHYNQTFGAVDIDVTNEGSDFNGDNQFDLCMATPSVGGLTSQLVVYLGLPDGSFSQQLVKTVQGQIFADCVGDFNGDSYLDIACINGAKRYLAIMYGDGKGHFLNEARYDVPRFDPCQMDRLDIDLDGDLDIVVATSQHGVGGSLFLFENQLNPPEYSAVPFQTLASGNVDLEIGAPSGGVINNVKSSIASGSFYRKALDGHSRLDAIASASATEPGEYRISVTPKKDRAGGELFSLRYRIGKTEYRIASNITMPSKGYSFPVYPNGDSPVRPALGEYIDSPQPTFSWQGAGQFEFELAQDASFSAIVDRATVSGTSYTPDVLLQKSETSPYYWRVRPAGADNWGTFSSFNVAASPTDVGGGPTDDVPASFWLSQNYPNPFNPSTVIEFNLPKAAQVKVEIFNVVGQKIATVIEKKMGVGKQSIEWNGHDALGKPVASGVYFYRISSEEFTATRKMVLLR